MTDVLDLIPPGAPLILRDGDRAVLAEQALEGLAPALAYRRTEAMHGRLPVADILSDADQRIDQLLHGEVFDVLHRHGDRAWGRARRDGVVGWISLNALAPGAPLAVRRVASVDAVLPLNALVGEVLPEGLSEADLCPVGEFETDPVAVAERLLGRPHALGARTSRETDCSGLVQQALLACGLPGPRRSDAQALLGRAVARAEARRGDLVVWLSSGAEDWTGHSALMLDAERIIHSTGARGGVVVELFAEVEARLTADGFATAVFRRV
ncbi:C40 family peptidase [Brevundimonas faecalis]|uniref:NlpC/P60 domain-containing protein n=1 Tax=Brevundimonas faecalis TaxID=947378 RepID=A0ABV2RB79_9CAUL